MPREKGYYHGRLGTVWPFLVPYSHPQVLSDAAPKPQLVTEAVSEGSPKMGSEWNQAVGPKSSEKRWFRLYFR